MKPLAPDPTIVGHEGHEPRVWEPLIVALGAAAAWTSPLKWPPVRRAKANHEAPTVNSELQDVLRRVYEMALARGIDVAWAEPSDTWRTARVAVSRSGETVLVFVDNLELSYIGPEGGGATPVPAQEAQGVLAFALSLLDDLDDEDRRPTA